MKHPRGARFGARFRAVQALAWWETEGWSGAPEALGARYAAMTDAAQGPCDEALLAALIAGVARARAALDAALAPFLPAGWTAARLDSTLRALLRAGAWELRAEATPRAQLLAAWVEVARAFYDQGAETGVVNAALDAFARARAEAREDAPEGDG